MNNVGLGSDQFAPSATAGGASIATYEGTAQSCEIVAEKIRLGSQDPRVLAWGDKALKEAGIDGRDNPSDLKKATVLLNALRAQTVYRQDPPGTEMIQSAVATLCLAPGLCVMGGDCDDMVVALGSVLLAQSIPTYVVKQSYGAGQQEHVLIAIDAAGTTYYLDPSTRAEPSTKTWAADEMWINPLDFAGATGVAGAEIVTLGRPLAQIMANHDAMMLAGPPGTLQASGPYAQAQTDLNNQVGVTIQAGDAYLAAKEYGNAIQAYMAAGNAGATSIGPEIDLAGAPNVTQPYTQKAWLLNGALQQAGGSATAAGKMPAAQDAQVAQGYAKQMLAYYQQAIAAGSATPNTVKGPGSQSGISPGWWILGLAVAGGVTWGLVRTKMGRRR